MSARAPAPRSRHDAWVLREPASGTRSALEALFVGRHLSTARMEVALELPFNEAVRAAVEAGAGATVISAAVAAPSLEAGLPRLGAVQLVGARLPGAAAP